MEVLVFKTSVETAHGVRRLKPLLDTVAGNDRWNFALDDRDRILRVISESISPQRVIRLLSEQGFHCDELED